MQNIKICGIILGLLLSGCTNRGALYTRVIHPYSMDFHDTPVGIKDCRVNEHRLKEPYTGVGFTATWTSHVLEKAAHDAGIRNLHYADLETFSILNGLYLRKILILYGD